MVARLPWFRGAAQLRLGDSSSARLVALSFIGAALGARSAPGADYCFDQRVSRESASARCAFVATNRPRIRLGAAPCIRCDEVPRRTPRSSQRSYSPGECKKDAHTSNATMAEPVGAVDRRRSTRGRGCALAVSSTDANRAARSFGPSFGATTAAARRARPPSGRRWRSLTGRASGLALPAAFRATRALGAGAENPSSTLRWFYAPGFEITRRLLAGEIPISHQGLDQGGRSTAPNPVAFVRAKLVASGVLEPRDESSARFAAWHATAVLRIAPGSDRAHVRAYATLAGRAPAHAHRAAPGERRASRR